MLILLFIIASWLLICHKIVLNFGSQPQLQSQYKSFRGVFATTLQLQLQPQLPAFFCYVCDHNFNFEPCWNNYFSLNDIVSLFLEKMLRDGLVLQEIKSYTLTIYVYTIQNQIMKNRTIQNIRSNYQEKKLKFSKKQIR